MIMLIICIVGQALIRSLFFQCLRHPADRTRSDLLLSRPAGDGALMGDTRSTSCWNPNETNRVVALFGCVTDNVSRGSLKSRGIEHHGDIGSILWMCKARRPCGSGNRQQWLASDPFLVVTRGRAKRSAATTSPHYFLEKVLILELLFCFQSADFRCVRTTV